MICWQSTMDADIKYYGVYMVAIKTGTLVLFFFLLLCPLMSSRPNYVGLCHYGKILLPPPFFCFIACCLYWGGNSKWDKIM